VAIRQIPIPEAILIREAVAIPEKVRLLPAKVNLRLRLLLEKVLLLPQRLLRNRPLHL
jgi:hypothetical protein